MENTLKIITKVGSDQAKEYGKYASRPMTYKEFLFRLWRENVPYDEVENYLWEKQEIVGDEGLADYLTAGEYAGMLSEIISHNEELVDATDVREIFDVWFCVELKDLMIDYGIDLDAPVDVDVMARMAESEEQQER